MGTIADTYGLNGIVIILNGASGARWHDLSAIEVSRMASTSGKALRRFIITCIIGSIVAGFLATAWVVVDYWRRTTTT